MRNLQIPPHFKRTMLELYGSRGQRWLDGMPALLAECEQRWSIEVQPPYRLTYNYVAPALRRDGARLVLKLGVPNPELSSEIAALGVFAGNGAAALMEADPERGLLLLERLEPGAPLSALADDAQAVSIAAHLMRKLWQPAPPNHSFPTLARWTIGLKKLRPHFGGNSGPFPSLLVDKAEKLLDELLASSPEPVLLHGDLHQDNILSAQRQAWLAIDPKGVVGEPTYETTPFLYNCIPEPITPQGLKTLLARRIDQFAAELELDRPRLIAWSVVQCVLSGWWSYSDHGHGWEAVISIAGLLSELL